jgi:hypothetical protein
MRIYIGFDDTDNTESEYGTGKVARWFSEDLPSDCRVWGVVRQQLLVDDAIPYTSHNSAACLIVETTSNGNLIHELTDRAMRHLNRHAATGSDPGVCIVSEKSPTLIDLLQFGLACTIRVMTQADARMVCRDEHLAGHGGTNDGIIGAAAAVGLTAAGWYGRFIEFGNLRGLPSEIRVVELEAHGIRLISMDRDACIPKPNDLVITKSWVRPRLIGGQPVLPVIQRDTGIWETTGGRRGKNNGGHFAQANSQ